MRVIYQALFMIVGLFVTCESRLVMEYAVKKHRIVEKDNRSPSCPVFLDGVREVRSYCDTMTEPYWKCESPNERLLLQTTSGKHVCIGEEKDRIPSDSLLDIILWELWKIFF
jgi:hypothetical protein